jgi:hypothetical protein
MHVATSQVFFFVITTSQIFIRFHNIFRLECFVLAKLVVQISTTTAERLRYHYITELIGILIYISYASWEMMN